MFIQLELYLYVRKYRYYSAWMFGGRAIYRLLSERLQSQATVKGSPVLSSHISENEREEIGSTTSKYLRAVTLFGPGVSRLLSFPTVSSCDEAEHGLGLLGIFGGFVLAPTTYYNPRRFSLSWFANWFCIIFGVILTIVAPVGGLRQIITMAKTYKFYQ